MLNYIQQHIKLILVIAVMVILALIGVLLVFSTKQPTPSSNTSAGDYIINPDNQFLLDDSISNEDKYLMQLGQNMTEDYGTAQLGNTLPLQDLLNQSTSQFSFQVQKMIDSVDRSKNTITTVGPNSIKLERVNQFTVTVTMDAVTIDKVSNKQINIRSNVDLVLQGGYWLVDNITIENR